MQNEKLSVVSLSDSALTEGGRWDTAFLFVENLSPSATVAFRQM